MNFIMEKLKLMINIFLVICLNYFAESKVITFPYEQEDCPCEDRAVITEGIHWDVDDLGRTTVNGYLAVIKPLYEPMAISCKIEQKRRGKWQFFFHQNFKDFCTSMFEEDKPYSFVVKYMPKELLTCPIIPGNGGNGTIPNAVYENDVKKYLKLTPDDVGNYRAKITGTAKVDGVVKEVMCMVVHFDIVEVDD